MTWLNRLERAATPRRRKWAYGVAGGVLAVLVTYRVLTGDQAAAWAYLAAMALGMATANTDTRTTSGMPASKG